MFTQERNLVGNRSSDKKKQTRAPPEGTQTLTQQQRRNLSQYHLQCLNDFTVQEPRKESNPVEFDYHPGHDNLVQIKQKN